MPIIKRPLRALIAVFGVIIAVGAFASPASASPYSNQTTVTVSDETPTAGSSVTFCGQGFQAGETVSVALDNGTTFPSVVASASGEFCTTVVLGASLTGAHTITGTGATSGATASVKIQVLGVSASTGGNAAGAGGSLAFTGAAVIAIGSLAVLLLLGGVIMMFAGKRRKIIA